MSARIVLFASCALLTVPLAARPLVAQSLRGSPASIDRMYREARHEHLSFFKTTRNVRNAASSGLLVRIAPESTFTLHEVGFPYVRPATLTFVRRLSAQYEQACDAPLVVTSAVRPATRQPDNSVAHSVHPTGMAVDLRKPTDASCLRWLRETLLELEDAGVLEATEEHHPPHFHVAVFPARYERYVAMREAASKRTQLASSAPAAPTSYTVREGDTLWDIAQRLDSSVAAILEANDLSSELIHPGQELEIPAPDDRP
jgi:hypothetical protein